MDGLLMVRTALVMIVVLSLVYLRLQRARRRGDRVCPQCGRPNPAYREYCRVCSARLVRR
jgi:predicted amidophosphoribosyltransferase